MLIPLSWLREYVDINMPFEKLAERMSEVGLTIESWKKDGEDIIFDPEITPNRPDWMSVTGIAREVAAATNSKFEIRNSKPVLKLKTKLEITYKHDTKICPRVSVILIKGVKVKSSPEWLQNRIKQIGLRPINNLVDITNYVLWLYGCPLHVFDYDKIRGHTMTTELSKGGEDFRSLDGVDYKLPPNAIIIKDVGRVIDLLPLKGGGNTAISNSTTNVLLHSIVCDPIITRRTSQALNLRSDSSAISERGVDPNGTTQACLKALEMILELAGGETASELIEFPQKPLPEWQVEVSHQKIEDVLGIKIDPKEVKEIFNSLACHPELVSGSYQVTIPTFRNDLHIEEDLIEEVGRIIGYNSFPKTLPASAVPTAKVAYAYDYDFDYEIKQILKGAGYNEIYTYSLASKGTVKLLNPISSEYAYLRANLLDNLLSAIKLNQPNFTDIKLYELGKQYSEKSEEYWLSVAQTGEKFYEIKGLVENLLTQNGIDFKIQPGSSNSNFHPGRSALVIPAKAGIHLGYFGEIHPTLLSKFGLKGHTTGFTLNFDLFKSLASKTKIYQPIPLYPPIIEDLTLTLPQKTLVGEVITKIKLVSKLITDVQLISTHENNYSFRISYQDKTKNLTDEDIAPIRARLQERPKQR